MVIVSPSLLSADFSDLRNELASVAQAPWLHLDVMDGEFVPNITFGAPVIKKLRPHSAQVFDTHLMINDPIRYIGDFAAAGADIITVHTEACGDIDAVIDMIHAKGKKAGLSVKPGTPVEVLYPYIGKIELALIMTVEPGFGGQKLIPKTVEKIKLLSEEIKKRRLPVIIEADGGITAENAKSIAAAGCTALVAGSAVFGQIDRTAAIRAIAG